MPRLILSVQLRSYVDDCLHDNDDLGPSDALRELRAFNLGLSRLANGLMKKYHKDISRYPRFGDLLNQPDDEEDRAQVVPLPVRSRKDVC